MPHPASKWRPLRRIAVSLSCALAIVFIASRTNRPVPLAILTSAPRPGDEIINSVDIDTRSINAALASLRAVSKTNILLEKSSLDPADKFIAADSPDTPPLHFKNVRLRSALDVVLHFRNPYVMELREDAASITVGGAGSSLVPVYLRIYDIRDLIPTLPPPQLSGPTYMQQRAISPQREVSEGLENIFEASTTTDAWSNQIWSLHVWSGRLIVAASDKGHRGIQQMLLMLRSTATLDTSEGKIAP